MLYRGRPNRATAVACGCSPNVLSLVVLTVSRFRSAEILRLVRTTKHRQKGRSKRFVLFRKLRVFVFPVEASQLLKKSRPARRALFTANLKAASATTVNIKSLSQQLTMARIGSGSLCIYDRSLVLCRKARWLLSDRSASTSPQPFHTS
jgi:hypothetical protein